MRRGCSDFFGCRELKKNQKNSKCSPRCAPRQSKPYFKKTSKPSRKYSKHNSLVRRCCKQTKNKYSLNRRFGNAFCGGARWARPWCASSAASAPRLTTLEMSFRRAATTSSRRQRASRPTAFAHRGGHTYVDHWKNGCRNTCIFRKSNAIGKSIIWANNYFLSTFPQ